MDYRNDNSEGRNSKMLIAALVLFMISVMVLAGLGFYILSDKNDSPKVQDEQSQSANVSSTMEATTQTITTTATTTALAQVNTQPAMEESESKTTRSATNNYYIIDGSDSRYVTVSDLEGMSTWELKCARNEIYARHGRKFDNSGLQNYFNSQAWYSGTVSASSFKEDTLNKYEKSNIEFIKKYEDGNVTDTGSDYNDYYILPYSDTSYVSDNDLYGLSKIELKRARNEIYARHGRRFDNQELQKYFDSQSWYSGTVSPSDFSESVLNKYEKANLATIKEYEDSQY